MPFKTPFKRLERFLIGILISFLSLMTFWARFPARDGEDIMNARENLQSSDPITYWGGFSSLVYGNFPSFVLDWQTILVLLQITICAIGLFILFQKTETSGWKKLSITFAVIYTSLVFSSQTTRDGTMFSLLILGYAILTKANSDKNSAYKLIASLTFLILGFAFRPWVAISALPLIYLLFSSKKKKNGKKWKLGFILISAILVLTPILLEKAATSSLNLRNSFPEQQVFVTDFAATYCYSNNNNSANTALKALKMFSSEADYQSKICNYFRLDNYHSLIQLDSNVLSAQNLSTDFALIGPDRVDDFHTIRNLWVKMLTHDPVTYLQNKAAMALKFAIASDTRGFRFLEQNNFVGSIKMFYFALYDLIITLHFISILAFFSYVIALAAYKTRKIKLGGILLSRSQILIMASVSLWLATSTLAYIGSNGRYTYSSVLLGLILLLTTSKENIPEDSTEKN